VQVPDPASALLNIAAPFVAGEGEYGSKYMTSLVMIERYLGQVRASRLVGLLGLLQAQGRMTTQQLAAELEVSPRTVLRDIEALSSAGIPVYATRGRRGGFALIDGFSSELPASRLGERPRPGPGAGRARIRLSPRGRRLAALLGRPAALRIRHGAPPVAGRGSWAEAASRRRRAGPRGGVGAQTGQPDQPAHRRCGSPGRAGPISAMN
jgi:biotin operon repressor